MDDKLWSTKSQLAKRINLGDCVLMFARSNVDQVLKHSFSVDKESFASAEEDTENTQSHIRHLDPLLIAELARDAVSQRM
jgi:hypothetical protein